MPYDEYGSGWDPTSSNVAKAYAQYASGNGGPSIGPLPNEQGFLPYHGPANIPGGISESGATRHDDPDLLTRIWKSLFGGPKQQAITSQALPPPGDAQQSPTPFGGINYDAPPMPSTSYKPATKITSSKAIADLINKMISGGGMEPPRASSGMPSWLSQASTMPSDAFTVPNYDISSPFVLRAGDRSKHAFNMLGMGTPAPRGQTVDMRGAESPFMSPYDRTGGMQFDQGGGVPGFMRGGYPELYNAPIRHTFDSGGESFVGSKYGDEGGRTDKVNARLSPKEYVMDAESMALLGDGNPDHGAKKMDEMRVQLRKQKGAALAKGKISPDAKPAMAYVAGNPMGDGLRRRGREKT